MSARARGYCFTTNNPTEEDEHVIFDLANVATYVVVGRETAPSTGTPHLQGFVYFGNKRTFQGVLDLLPYGSHLEVKSIGSTFRQCSEYCKKDGDYFESGECPMDPERKGDAGKLSAQQRWDLAIRGDFTELAPEHYTRYRAIHAEFRNVADREELNNFWICGHSGCGKSKYVRDTYPVFYSKGMNKWWDGYVDEDVVLLDDFDPKHAEFLSYYLKIWSDHYVFNAEVKGGMLKIRPKTIIVTSQYSIEMCFAAQDVETVEAIKRRFTVVALGNVRVPTAFATNFNH